MLLNTSAQLKAYAKDKGCKARFAWLPVRMTDNSVVWLEYYLHDVFAGVKVRVGEVRYLEEATEKMYVARHRTPSALES